MSKKKRSADLKLFIANLFAAIFLSWYTIYLMKSTVNWWGAGSMRPGFFWMDAFPWLIIIFSFVLWALQKALLQSWRNATMPSLFLSGTLFLSPFLFNILPYWQGNLTMPFTLSLVMFGWSVPIVFLRNRQEQEKQLLRELREARKAKVKKLNRRENASPRISSYSQKTGERTMRDENRFPFYISYHLIMALLLAFGIAFFMLHGYSMNHRELNSFEQLYRTFSYVFPQWYFVIFSAAGILALFSFGGYGLLRGMSRGEDGLFMSAYVISLLASLGIFGLLYGSMLGAFAFILIPGIVQCLILAAIEWAWGKAGEKAKRA